MEINRSEQSLTLLAKETLQSVEPGTKKERFVCLDVYRGLTMAGMILVNMNGSDSCVIWPLEESRWNGLSTADCVFPSFLFIMGLAIPFSLKPDLNRGKIKEWLRIIYRSCMLFTIGLLLNIQARIYVMIKTDTFFFRYMGVFQRIGICYLIISSMFMAIKKKYFFIHFIILATFSTIYLSFMYNYDVPNYVNTAQPSLNRTCGKAVLTAYCNFSGYLDRLMYPQKFMIYPSDPEGLFSTLTAVINPFAGLCFCLLFQKYKSNKLNLLKIWLLTACALIWIGFLLSILNPLNKQLWSFSFAFATSGISGLALSLCFAGIDFNQNQIVQKIIRPFIWMGMNPLIFYIGQIFLLTLLRSNIYINYNDRESLWKWLFKYGFESWLVDCYIASIVMSVFFLLLLMLMAYFLFKKQIFIKL